MQVKKIYGPYTNKKDGRRNIIVYYEDGRRKCMSYARFLMQEHLCRELEDWETVDHINGDPTDDRIENYQILSLADNIRKSARETEMYNFTCVCGAEASVKMRHYKHNQLKQGKSGPFCSKSCAARQTYVTHKLEPHDIKHGTDSAYKYHKCRCDVCREGNRLRKRRQRLNRKLNAPVAQ